MAMTGICGIHLYCDTSADSTAARKYCDDNKIPYTLQWFADTNQHPEVFAPLATWHFTTGDFASQVSGFPFIIYSEMHDDISDPKMWPVAFIPGPDFSKSNILELLKLKK